MLRGPVEPKLDSILGNVLATIGAQVMTALGRQVTSSIGPKTPVEVAIESVGIQTVDAEVIPALEAWIQTADFARCLAALASGEQDFNGEALADNFVKASGFYAGTRTRQLASETLASFGSALEEALMGADAGVAVHDRHERRRFDLVNQKVDLVYQGLSNLQNLLAGQASPSIGGWWQRYDAYELEEGWIRPRADVQMTSYDPWDEHRKNGPRIYEELCALSDRMRQSSNISITPGGRIAYTLPDDVSRDVLQWCARYGLPGSLLLRTESVVLAPRWSAGGSLAEHMHGSPPPCHPTITAYWRVNGGWSSGGHTYPFTDDEEELERRRHVTPGSVIPPADRQESWPTPGVAIRDLTDGELRFEPLDATWGRFFPKVPDDERATFNYPPPLSEEFWRQYGERLEDFMNAAFYLATALEWVRGGRQNPLDELDHDGKPMRLWCFNTGRIWLHGLVRPVSPYLNRLDGGGFESLWASPSLLSSLAMMALVDLTSQ